MRNPWVRMVTCQGGGVPGIRYEDGTGGTQGGVAATDHANSIQQRQQQQEIKGNMRQHGSSTSAAATRDSTDEPARQAVQLRISQHACAALRKNNQSHHVAVDVGDHHTLGIHRDGHLHAVTEQLHVWQGHSGVMNCMGSVAHSTVRK